MALLKTGRHPTLPSLESIGAVGNARRAPSHDDADGKNSEVRPRPRIIGL